VRKRKDSDQLTFDLKASALGRAKTPQQKTQGKLADAPRFYRLEDAKRKRERIEESKHIRAIIEMVRHYK
jgi:hypothetical protein